MKRFFVVLIPFIFVWSVLSAQQETSWPGKFFRGYSKSVTTGKFSYHSPQPDVTESLLLRSVDSASFISWETEKIPADFNDPSANFVWMFGIDANAESHKYRLYVNGTWCLTFANPVVSELKPWTVTGTHGSSLTFLTTMLDKYDDPMGYAILKLPSSLIKKGEPQVIKVVGESAGSSVWYMTFESAVEEKLDVVQEEAILRNGEQQAYSVLFNFVHLGAPVTGKLVIPSFPDKVLKLQPGYNRVQILVPVSADTVRYRATVSLAGQASYSKDFIVHPIRHWTIYLVQHAHTDIGYTRPQTEILPEHLRYIDYALDYCDQTDTLPDDAKFRWTCETSWALREYLSTRPVTQVERLRKRVAEGRIELTGLFLNGSDLSDEATIASWLQPVRQFRDLGIPVTSAMQDDINGVPWCLTDYLPGCGINFLTMGINETRSHKPFNRPTTFCWVSPSGKKLLVNRPEHYMFGNSLGILTNTETFGQALFLHLSDIMKKGYPYDHYSIQFSGYLTDNSPPSTTACKLVEKWNSQYVWPKLRLATIGEFGKYMLQQDPSTIPSYRGAWPDWWMDGFGSACMETAYTRMSHEDFIANQGMMAMALLLHISLPQRLFFLTKEIADDLAFYDEHTFGAAESISDPLVENSVVQWNEKASYAWDAVKKNRILREEIAGLIQEQLPRLDLPSVTVFNTLGWSRSGVVKVYIDHQILPPDKSFSIIDNMGIPVPVQKMESREEGSYWAIRATNLPPFGYATYRIVVGKDQRADKKLPFNGVLENDDYRIRINPSKGTIESLFDKQLQEELVDQKAPYQPGQFIYERLGKNRHQLEVMKLDESVRTVLENVTVSGSVTDGPVWQSITLKGSVPGCAEENGVSCEIRLYKTEKKIEFLYSLRSFPVTDPEGGYVAFPFALENGHLLFEVQGGQVVPGKDQLEGSASDWDGIQNFVAVKNEKSQIVVVSPEIPLVQLGAINLGKFSMIAHPESNSIYSWVFNNYWTTNFRASQEGELKWTYKLTSAKDTSNVFSTKFGWDERVPLVARVFPVKGKDTLAFGKSLMCLRENILLVSVRPSNDLKGIVLQLREISGHPGQLDWDDPLSAILDLHTYTRAQSASEVSVLEEKIAPITNRLEFKPYEAKFVKIVF